MNPFVVDDSLFFQSQRMLVFLDFLLKGKENGVEDWPLIRYYNIGDPDYKESNEWPISGTLEKKFFLRSDDHLEDTVSNLESKRSYKVDFGVQTSEFNRWTTQMEGPVKGLNNRSDMDGRMLVYSSTPVEEDLQITGTPEVSLCLSSTHEDRVVLVYLEDADGKSIYLTEGGPRLIHRKMAEPSDSTFNLHAFREGDAAPMVPGQVEEISLRLLPTSVTIKKGHSIRIAIAGADKGIFDKCPKRGKPTLEIHASKLYASHIVLPVVGDGKGMEID